MFFIAHFYYLVVNSICLRVVGRIPYLFFAKRHNECEDLAYTSWEWSSRSLVKSLAKEAGFSCGYAHLRSMSGASAMDSFVRGFYPDYDKDALIIDVRNNRGGN